MRISDRYIGGQVLSGTLAAVVVLGVVLVLGNLFKEIRPLLVDQKAPAALVLRFVVNVLPMSLMYTVPWGFLSAVLLVFGRMSAHHEITAMRVAGTGLVRLAVPVFLIGLVLSFASLWLNSRVVPVSKATIAQLVYQQASRDPGSLLKPGVVQGNFRGDGNSELKVLIESGGQGRVAGFHLHKLPGKDGAAAYVHAREAALAVDRAKGQLRLRLEDAFFEERKADGRVETAIAGSAEPLLIDLQDPGKRRARPGAMTNREIGRHLAENPGLAPERALRFRTEVWKRVSFSMASLAFAFVAVPLGMGARRRETSAGLVWSLLIGAGYFLVSMVAGQAGSESAVLGLLWLPNLVCVVLGIWLFRRARFR
jgi:lipopolysaccharide export LptBFGC system permease protein LptF